jgi:hypothetical protein
MIRIKPTVDFEVACPECRSSETRHLGVKFESIHVLADCQCLSCGIKFYHVLPVGHTSAENLCISKSSRKLYNAGSYPSWLVESVMKQLHHTRKENVAIKRIVKKKCKDVIILNTLDTLYGHTLLKLYNAVHHIDTQPEYGLIVIIPSSFLWLVPEGCAEVWTVDLKLSELAHGYDAIGNFISTELNNYQTVYLSKAYSHPDISSVDVERFTRVKPFDLAQFSRKRPVITFILREDRIWFKALADFWIYRAGRKLKLDSSARQFLVRRQNKLVKRTIECISRQVPNAIFNVVGLGTMGSFDGFANDLRTDKVTPETETNWCQAYAQSHVVVGVHGSNMLLPTAHAAGCVEILPQDRFGNMIQDISVRYNSRLQLFFYRFADQFAKPQSVCSKVVAMIRDYDLYHKNMVANIYHKKDGQSGREKLEMSIEHSRDDVRH